MTLYQVGHQVFAKSNMWFIKKKKEIVKGLYKETSAKTNKVIVMRLCHDYVLASFMLNKVFHALLCYSVK